MGAGLTSSSSSEAVQVLSGRAVAKVWRDWLGEVIRARRITPAFAIVQVGSDPASTVYVRNKLRSAERVGIRAEHVHLPEGVSPAEFRKVVRRLWKTYHGVIVQMPVPAQLQEALEGLLQEFPVEKDVDGFSVGNLGALACGRLQLVPATPLGILVLMHTYGIAPAGKHIVVVGRSRIVGTPLALLLSRAYSWANGTVTVCHSRTQDLEKITRQADVVVVAVGRPHFLRADHVRPGAIVIDVGIHRGADGTLTGDVHPSVYRCVRAYTPVPGGVGPMTVSALLFNVYAAALWQERGIEPVQVITQLLEEECRKWRGKV